jgi:steroid 5-alpha reductase family enzyme
MFQNKLLAEKCAWTAFQLAGMTKYTKWESSTVSSLLEMLQQSRKLTEQEYNERYIYTSVENMEPF